MLLPSLTPFIRRASRTLALACTLGASVSVLAFGPLVDNPDWKETDAPPPPAFSQSRLLPIEMPPYMNLRFGVDPATLSVTGDGVVRYVVVASRPGGAVNAFYEAVRCATNEMKTYARYDDGAWHPVATPEWKNIDAMNSRYTAQLARQGLCRGRAPRASVGDMVRELKNPDSY